MPLFSGQNDPGIPGAALEYPANSNLQQLHTHSAKFPIVREVIISNIDKNSKFPILQELRKKPKKAIIAPDIPSKQMAAWTQVQMQSHQILPDQTHPGLTQSVSQSAESTAYRQPYNVAPDIYGNSASKQNAWDSTKSPYQQKVPEEQNSQISLQQSIATKTDIDKSANARGVTKTYHAIKDIISGKFKKDDCKTEKTSLNNSMQELRRSQILEDGGKEKTPNIQDYGQPVNQHHYNQHILQQHMMAQQQAQAKPRSPHQYSQLMQARSQEILATRYEEQMTYQNYGSGAIMRSPHRVVQEPQSIVDQRFRQIQNNRPLPIGNEIPKDRQAVLAAFERRSAQQLERDNLKRGSFEARRTSSHPQLLLDDEVRSNNMGSGFQHQEQVPNYTRRGSQNNLLETGLPIAFASNQRPDNGLESDDGGFLKRSESKETCLERGQAIQKNTAGGEKVTEALQGNSRKKLEVEIGKIEGVYNLNHRLTFGCDGLTETAHHTQTNCVNKMPACSSATSSDYDKTGERTSNIDSGRGSAAYSSGRRLPMDDLQNTDVEITGDQTKQYGDISNQADHDSEWVDIVEHELRHILEPKLQELSLQNNNPAIANSTVSESISSMTPPLLPLSVAENSSPTMTPRNMAHYKHSSLHYDGKLDYEKNGMNGKPRYLDSSQKYKSSRKVDPNTILRGKQIFGLDNTDLTSTTTRSLDLESMLEGQTDSDGDLSMADAKTIRKQLEGLETMYSEVLKLLGVNKKTGRYQPSDPKCSKRRYGSMSSLISSSVSSIRRERRSTRCIPEDRRRGAGGRGEPRATARRFQRLEAHVVTLARSVAHLSSEMRTQHMVTQEMEAVRQEVAALRAQTNMLNIRSQSALRPTTNRDLPSLANPTRVKKLTKFFGDEPPLLRLFLRKLGYEKYATTFENEKIGMIELPYLTEDRLQKMGIPLGPRLRIMQEAQISVCKENTLCIV
ncbi:uncharacterized protein LOC115875852 isoform X2 [Sitophilus oryzae]|uniref:Uncharacterized protein LOC115875852 isoform X2 n=1 Tax=Sitophilus oryzae TaxID=7048 RepID=A0A6J2X7T9_SITOR|nr:uncharacterized protein LOC115875852 isoform X2 [Sitophilus oryzae]